MKKGILKTIFLVSGLGILLLGLGVLPLRLGALAAALRSPGCAIIGGADGPTLLFLLSQALGGPLGLLLAALLLAFLISGGLLILKGRKTHAEKQP